MKKTILPIGLLFLWSLPALAQQSPSYRQEEHVVNAGGSPQSGVVLSSPGFRITLSSLGNGLVSMASTSASFQVQGGFVAGHPAAGEVRNLRLTDDVTLEWDAEPSAGTYNLYRDLISNLPALGYGACRQGHMATTTTQDIDPGATLPLADGLFYLVTAENSLRQEGSKGLRSGGAPRLGGTCP